MRSFRIRSTAVAGAVLITAGSSGLLLTPLSPAGAAPAPEPGSSAAISEIAYAGPDDTDFIEIAAPAGTDLSGWIVGSVSRGGTPQSAAHVVTVPADTRVPASGAHAVRVPITNAVKAGSGADGSYGSSAFLVDGSGTLRDFAQIGGVAGGRGVTAGTSSLLPQAVTEQAAKPTGATAAKGRSIARTGHPASGTWAAGEPTPGELPSGPAPTDAPTDTPTDTPTGAPTDSPTGTPTTDPTDPTDPANLTPIAEIQGTGPASPLEGQTVTTRGVVTATYPAGGLDGYFIQTPGSGGDAHSVPGASEGIFVYSKATAGKVKPGLHVEVTGTVSEYYGQTQLTVAGSGLRELTEPAAAPKPFTAALPDGDTARESLEGMLVQPAGPITVADTYTANRYGEIGLTNGPTPLRQPTDAHRPGSPEAKQLETANAARFFVLDDGATRDFTGKANDVPVPYVSTQHPVRVGAEATFTSATVLGYGHETWRLQPTEPVTGDTDAAASPARFANTRPAAPEAVGGQVRLASYNVLNYFPTTGDQLAGCQYHTDRQGTPITVKSGCAARGAATAESFARQQAKIVNGINTLDASVVGLEEIEQSAAFKQDRDAALRTLVDALNAAAGEKKWAAASSPAQVPTAGEDVIRTAFIYQPALVTPVGTAAILDDPAFANARAPLAQAFARSGGQSAEFLAIVNHFKSKGSGSGPGNEDSGDGQGASNADRVRQAQALVRFAQAQQSAAGTDRVFLLGDFNAYTFEDPMQVFYDAGYTDLGSAHTDKQTYLFGGRVGSLDHILASGPAAAAVTGADVWNINSGESIGLEYSRFNANVRNLYDASVYRSSDHDPLIVGFDVTAAEPTSEPTAEPTSEPTGGPSEGPSDEPTSEPTGGPTAEPTGGPSTAPSADASTAPNPAPTSGADDHHGGTGAGDSDGPAAAGPGSSGAGHRFLPRTGAELGGLGLAAGLVGLGAVALILSRRRR